MRQYSTSTLWFMRSYLFCIVLFLSCSTTKQPVEVTGASAQETAQAIAEDHWIFIANYANPQRGQSRVLTSRYSVILKKDTLSSSLPYFGRAYTAVIGESTSPLDFTSTRFSIDKDDNGKGRWKLNIRPDDKREIQSYSFTFYTNGSAQLNVQLTNRSAISFNGSVMPIRK